MIKRPVYLVDAFSDEPLRGNCAAVVLDAGGLEAPQMQRIAKGLMQAETVFVSGARDPAASFHLRWFTPQAEVRFCGHATLAALHVLVEVQRMLVPKKPGAPAGTPDKGVVRCSFSSLSGLLRVELWRDEKGRLQTRFEAPPTVFADHLVTDELITSLGIIPEVLDQKFVIRHLWSPPLVL